MMNSKSAKFQIGGSPISDLCPFPILLYELVSQCGTLKSSCGVPILDGFRMTAWRSVAPAGSSIQRRTVASQWS